LIGSVATVYYCYCREDPGKNEEQEEARKRKEQEEAESRKHATVRVELAEQDDKDEFHIRRQETA